MVNLSKFFPKFQVRNCLTGVTSLGGLIIPHLLAIHAGFGDIISSNVSRKKRDKGYSDFYLIWTIVLGLLAGCEHFRDYKKLYFDKSLSSLLNGWRFPHWDVIRKYVSCANISHALQMKRVNSILFSRFHKPNNKVAVIDIDSSLISAKGRKQGARFAYNGARSLQYLFAFMASSAELLYSKLLKGSATAKKELPRLIKDIVNQCEAKYKKLVFRIDAGFYTNNNIVTLEKTGHEYIVGYQQSIWFKRRLQEIPERKWSFYRKGRQCCKVTFDISMQGKRTFVIMRKETPKGAQLDLFDGRYQYHVLVTNMKGSAKRLLNFYFKRGNCENFIRELKSGLGLNKLPCHRFNANAFWLQISQLAYNVSIWIKQALPKQYAQSRLKTLRFNFLHIPARLTYPNNITTIDLPDFYDQTHHFSQACSYFRKVA